MKELQNSAFSLQTPLLPKMGGNIKNPGLYGGLPDLENLDNGDLIYKVDFRSVYNALLTDWLKVGTDPIISKKITSIPLFV